MWQPNKELPMYKDKPYAYPASRRPSVLERRRTWIGAALALFTLLWVFGVLPSSGSSGNSLLSTTSSSSSSSTTTNWFGQAQKKPGDWEARREAVREAFKKSWDGYERYAWGKDEYYPLSKRGRQMTPTGMGWIIVDALDTLMIMNLTSRLSHAREWMTTSLNYTQDQEVNTFETTIRMLGGLLSAHYLSNTFPDLAPLTDDDEGAAGEDLYLEKAADLADRLSGAFDSQSGLPYASVNLATRKPVASHADGGASSTAEATTLQLELKYLALLMGEKYYWEIAEQAMKVVDDNGAEDGLVPIFIYANTGKFREENIRLGSRGDSYYEYLIKQYLQTAKQEPIYKDMWDQTLAGVHRHLIGYTKRAHFTVLGERPNGLKGEFEPKEDHLVCFMAGTIALAQTEGRTLAEARKMPNWTKRQEDEVMFARELMKTCWGMYKASASGLAGEITHFELMEPQHMETDGRLASKEVDWHAAEGTSEADWKQDFIIKPQDSHNLQRPETVESLFYMWRITGDDIYREWGWEMFSDFMKWTAADEVQGDDAGFTSLSHADQIPPQQKDNMESFWLAETLKYLYLLFSPNDLLPLDQVVFNTEAHPLPVFKLQRGLKTGWTRKPRDKAGKVVSGSGGGGGGGGAGNAKREGKKGGAPDKVKHVTVTQVAHVVTTKTEVYAGAAAATDA